MVSLWLSSSEATGQGRSQSPSLKQSDDAKQTIYLRRVVVISSRTLKARRIVDKSDVEASQYDLGTTSVRLIRVGSIVQILFSNKLEAKFFYEEAATRFKRDEREFGR